MKHMRKRFALLLAVLTALSCLMLSAAFASSEEPEALDFGNGPFSLDAADYADQWEYHEDGGTAYYSLTVVYCENPVLPSAEYMTIYAPAA